MKKQNKITKRGLLLLAISFLFFSQIIFILSAPEGPSTINVTSNSTRLTTNATSVNNSGGYISTINMSAVIKNLRWKAFVGWVDGSFTLDDAAAKTIYDWTLSTITGEVYATRKATTVNWSAVDCASIAEIDAENTAMGHTSTQDNITATFRRQAQTHRSFIVGGINITANQCNGTLNTYDETEAANESDFEEVVLFDDANLVYSTILMDNATGYDGNGYDFQMIVPENGTAGFGSATPYYLYVELN